MVGHLSQMAESLIRIAHSELVAYAGMILILTAFVLETRGILHSKERLYLIMMALGSGLLAVRAYLIDEWRWRGFFLLILVEVERSDSSSYIHSLHFRKGIAGRYALYYYVMVTQ